MNFSESGIDWVVVGKNIYQSHLPGVKDIPHSYLSCHSADGNLNTVLDKNLASPGFLYSHQFI
jgi:hypothetical protein